MANVKLNIVTATNLQGLNQLEAKLKEVQKIVQMPDSGGFFNLAPQEIQKTVTAANTLQLALRAAFDTKLNTINIEKFNTYIKNSGYNVQELYQQLKNAGVAGQQAFLGLSQSTAMMGRSIKQTSTLLTEMQTTMKNTVKWGISSGLWNNMLSSTSQAWTYVKGLNSDLNDIRIVTGKSANEMERFAKTANKAAKELAVSTRDYTQGALLYYQQGDDEETVKTKTGITAKASNVTGQDMSTVSEQLTAVWNGYQVANQAAKEGMQVYEEYVDKLAAVAATTASDLEEQATAMSKVASAAHTLGVGFDDLNAQIATIESVTRQDPESVGTALKTIYARLGDLKVDGVDEFGVTLGEVSSQLAIMGVDILDTNGNMKDMSTIMEDIANKWQLWTSAQKQAAAIAMAGKRQYNNLFALFENQDMYNKALSTSMEASGTLAEQQAIAVESLENKLERLTTTTERFYKALFNEDSIGATIDGFTSILDSVAGLTETLGGLQTLLPFIGSLMLKTFSGDIAKSVTRMYDNFTSISQEKANAQRKQAQFKELEKSVGNGGTETEQALKKEQQTISDYYKQMSVYKKQMTDDDIKEYNILVKQKTELGQQNIQTVKNLEAVQNKVAAMELYDQSLNKVYTEEVKNQKVLDDHLDTIRKMKTDIEATVVGMENFRNSGYLDKNYTGKQTTNELQDKIIAGKEEQQTIITDMANSQQMPTNAGITEDTFRAQRMLEIRDALKEVQIEGRNTTDVVKDLNEKLNQKYDTSQLEQLVTSVKKVNKESNQLKVSAVGAFNEIEKELKKAFKDVPHAQENIEKLREKFIELVTNGDRAEDVLSIIFDEYNEDCKEAIKNLSQLEAQQIEENKVNQQFGDIIQGFNMEGAINNITRAVSGGIMAFGAIRGMLNSIKAASDDSLSSFERMKTVLSGLGATFPMLVSGLTSVVFGLSSFTTMMKAATVAEAAYKLVTVANLKIMDLANSKTILGTLLTQLFTKTKKGEAAAEALATVQKELSTGATWGQVAANVALQASAWPLLVILGLLLAAFAAIAVVMIAVSSAEAKKKAAYENAAKAAKAELEAQQQLTQAAIEHKDAIQDVVSIYDDLSDKYEENEITLKDLRSQVAKALTDYGMYDEALKVLISDYEEINKLLKEQEKTSLEKVVEEARQELGLVDANAKADLENYIMQEYGDNVMEDGGWIDIDFNGTEGHQTSAMEMYRILKDKYDVDVSGGEKIDSSDLAKLASGEDYYKIISDLSNINDAGKEVNMIIEALNKAREVYTNANTTEDELKQAIKDLTILTTDTQNISNLNDYTRTISSMVEEVKNEGFNGDEEEAAKWASDQLREKLGDNGLKLGLQYSIVTRIADQNGQNVEEVINNIDDDLNSLSQKELEIIFNLKVSDENELESIINQEDFENLSKFKEYEEIVSKLGQVLSAENKTKLLPEEIDTLFQLDTFKNFINMSKEEFELLDYKHQSQLLSKFYNDSIKQAEIYQQTAADTATKIAESTSEKLKGIDERQAKERRKFIEDNTTIFGESILKKDNITEEDFGNQSLYYSTEMLSIDDLQAGLARVKYIAQKEGVTYAEAFQTAVMETSDDGSLTKEAAALSAYGDLVDTDGFGWNEAISNIDTLLTEYDEQYSNFVEGQEQTKKDLETQLSEANALIDDTKNWERDYKIEVQVETQNFKKMLTDLENFSSEYQTLNSIIEDYNENNGYTVDNLVALISMSTEMLACLEFENGALKINADALKQVALAKVDDSIATTLSTTQKRLEALATGDLNAAEVEAIKTTAIHTYEVDRLSGALQGGEESLRAYLEELSNLTGEQSTDYNQYSGQIIKDAEAALIPLMDLREQINNNDFSLIGDTSAKDKELKILDDEFDRYWDLNKAIEKTSQAIDELADAQDKLTRGELQDSLREQNDLLEQQIVNYQNLRKEQEKEAGELKGKLLTFGVDFNADGSIANYAEVTQEALNYYNNLIERRKSGKITDSQLETGEKSYEEFKETLERYDSLYYDEMVETAENIADTQREILENNLQDFELSITIKTDAAEFDREVKDFKTEIAKDFTKAFKDIDSVIEKSQFDVESYGESFNAIAAGISKVEEEILKLHNGENSDMFSSITEAQEKLKELNKEAMEHASNMKAAYEEAWEAYLEGIDQSQEKFDDLQEKYSKINEELEYQKELIELIYGPKAYDLMDKFYEKQKENSLSQIKSLQYEKELWLSKYDAEAAQAGDEDQLKIAERISQIQSDLNSNVTSYIQLLKDEYANTISGILSNFESQLTNGSSLDDIAEEWERLTENSDKYFNNVEGLYETQTLANKIKDSINDTISVKNQEKLQALYDREIEYLREKENLTQYDLDAAEARYQIALKEIALEEARENKNAMKLMRDTNGNWSYQYVADEDNIAEKQQELSDAIYKFYELSDKAYKENLESIQKLNQEYFDKAEEIATNELLTEQEKELKLEELRKWYLNQYQLLVSENEIIRQNLANGTVGVLNNLYNQDVENFENMTLQEQAALTQVKELGIASFAELEDKARQNIEGIGNSINIVAEQNIPEMTSKTQELADTWGADDGASVKAQSLDAFNSMMETSKQYQITLSEVAAAVKEDWGENGIAGAISNATQYVIDLEEATKNLCNDTKTNLATYKDSVDEISTSWGKVKTAIEDSIKQLNELYKLQGNPPPKISIPGGTGEQGGVGGFADVSNNIGGGGGGGKESGNPPDNNSSIVGYLLGADLQASPGGNRKYDLDNGKEYSVKAYDYVDYGKSSYAPYPIRVKLADDREGYVAPGSLYSLRWGKNGVPYRDKLVNTFSKVGSFDTGGYTGEWGSDGRMAMLHEKELVLNKEDTSNILAAVNGIRQFSSIESAISKGIASMIMNMAGVGVNANYNTNEAKGNQTEQVFNITAEFPNANNVSEIREAILSLPGLASQQVGLNLI